MCKWIKRDKNNYLSLILKISIILISYIIIRMDKNINQKIDWLLQETELPEDMNVILSSNMSDEEIAFQFLLWATEKVLKTFNLKQRDIDYLLSNIIIEEESNRPLIILDEDDTHDMLDKKTLDACWSTNLILWAMNFDTVISKLKLLKNKHFKKETQLEKTQKYIDELYSN